MELIDRRTLMRRAAVAGAVAWTAPMILDSVTSPAAAMSGAAPTFTSLGSFSDTTSGLDTIAATGFAPSTAGHAVLVFVATRQQSSSASIAVESSGPLGSVTPIGSQLDYVLGATKRWSMRAFWAVGTGAGGQFNVHVAPTASRNLLVSVVQVNGENSGAPIADVVSAQGNAGSPNGVTFNPPASGNSQVFFVSNRTTATWTVPGGFVGLDDLSSGVDLSLDTSATTSPVTGIAAAVPTGAAVRWGAIGLEIAGA